MISYIMTSVSIQPVEIQQPPLIETKLRVIITSITLNVSASIDAQLLDSNDYIVDIKHLTLEQPEYSQWGSDDNFIIQWTANKLGLTIIQ